MPGSRGYVMGAAHLILKGAPQTPGQEYRALFHSVLTARKGERDGAVRHQKKW